MSNLNETPLGERCHIAFFGKRNAGKSSLINALTGQDIAIVSNVPGTTTDPVEKTMEILPLGPVVLIDTPGLDDAGPVGDKRVKSAKRVLARADLAVVVIDAAAGATEDIQALIQTMKAKGIPYLMVYNKADLLEDVPPNTAEICYVSARQKTGIEALKNRMAELGTQNASERVYLKDLVAPGQVVVLVIPIDSSAPKSRIILPQQMAIRDLLDADAAALCVQPQQLAAAVAKTDPALVVTDSQAFETVSAIVPQTVKLTSFSILMARYRGFLETAVAGVAAMSKLADGDRVLISEGCTHHRQCEDIGTVKLPNWLKKYAGKELVYETSSGRGFPDDLTPYKLVIHCGGCMLNDQEVIRRMRAAQAQGVPFTNYGIAIAQMNGILKRSLEIFPDLYRKL